MSTPGPTSLTYADRPGALANYPHAKQVGDLLFVSGLSSRRSDGTHAGVTRHDDGRVTRDIAAQTEGCLENLRVILQRAGGSLAQLVDLTAFLVDMADYDAFNRIYNRHFDRDTGPARTTVGVRELPHPDLLIELKVVAHIPQEGP